MGESDYGAWRQLLLDAVKEADHDIKELRKDLSQMQITVTALKSEVKAMKETSGGTDESLRHDIDRLEDIVKKLQKRYWMEMGGAAVIGAILSFLMWAITLPLWDKN